MLRHALIAATAIVFSAPCFAAQLSEASGDVLINRGNGFTKGNIGDSLKPGDRVMIGSKGGNAKISYNLACFQNVVRGQVVTVSADPCQGAGVAGGGAGLAALGGAGAGTVVVGAVAITAVAVGVSANVGNKSDEKKNGSSP